MKRCETENQDQLDIKICTVCAWKAMVKVNKMFCSSLQTKRQ